MALLVVVARVIVLKSLLALGRSSYAETYRITKRPLITDSQLERESVWKFGYIYDTIAMLVCYYYLNVFHSLPLWNWNGLLWQIIFHATLVEFIYYWWHRALHFQWLYKKYHQYHHKSINTEPTTALSFEIFERVSYTFLFAIAPICTDFIGQQSYLTFSLYFIWFDIMNEGGHINFEVAPNWYFKTPLKYLFYTPTFHSVHHTKYKKNYSLFMPWTDMVFGTATHTHEIPEEILPTRVAKSRDFVLLVHPAGLSSALYSKKIHPWFFAIPNPIHKYQKKIWMWLYYPYLLLASIYWNLTQKNGFHTEEDFTFSNLAIKTPESSNGPLKNYYDGGTWIIRNYGVQYLLPSFKKLIQTRIEEAVLDAVKQNIRVVILGNFNKAEWMNHGGTDIVEKHKDKLKGTYISHGDTLSASVVYNYTMQLKQQNYWNKSVFVTGATSKIGRAVCLSLANQGIRVVMLTQCKERFDEIAAEAGENSKNLVFASNLSQGKTCDLWLTGKMIPSGSELLNAIPADSTVVNFAVPDPLTLRLLKSRPDILHLDSGLLAYDTKAMSPKFTWLLPSGIIYACLGGGIVHSVLGYEKHEVGPVIISEMDKYWKAALQLGFSIPAPSSFHSPIIMPAPKNI